MPWDAAGQDAAGPAGMSEDAAFGDDAGASDRGARGCAASCDAAGGSDRDTASEDIAGVCDHDAAS